MLNSSPLTLDDDSNLELLHTVVMKNWIFRDHTSVPVFMWTWSHKQNVPLYVLAWTLADVLPSADKRMQRQAVMCAHLCADGFSTVNDRIYSRAQSSFTYFHFSRSINALNFSLPPSTHKFPLNWLCESAHLAAECLCHSVLLQGREWEACLFQGTPPELMFHTCAQCATLYRASQVHCINCWRKKPFLFFLFSCSLSLRGGAAVVVVWGSFSTSSSSFSLACIQSLNIHI